jgi:hypothetical protein
MTTPFRQLITFLIDRISLPKGCVFCIVPDGFRRRVQGAIVLKPSGAWRKTGEKLSEKLCGLGVFAVKKVSEFSVSSVRDRGVFV